MVPAEYEFGSLELLNSHQNKSGKLLQNDHFSAAKQKPKLIKENSIIFHFKTYKDYQSVVDVSYPCEYEFGKKLAADFLLNFTPKHSKSFSNPSQERTPTQPRKD